MYHEESSGTTVLKFLAIWAGTVWGGISLSNMVLFATLVYTILQIWILIRKLRKEKQNEPEADD